MQWLPASPSCLPHYSSPNIVKVPQALQPRCAKQKLYRTPEDKDDGSSEIVWKLPPNVKSITSTSNPFVKHCVKLRQNSSYRHLHGSVVVVGETPIREIFSWQRTLPDQPAVECLFALENCRIPEVIDDDAVRIVNVNSQVIRKLSGLQSDESVQMIALLRIPSSYHILNTSLKDKDCPELFPSAHRILVLEGIQDPGNMGTLLRSATAFRWSGIFLLPGCCDPFNDKALRASRGSCFQIPIVSGSWSDIQTLRETFNMKMVAGHPASSHSQSPVIPLSKDLADSVVHSPLCLVLGSEGTGLSKLTREVCELVTITMPGEFESLNVSVAGGIFMYMLQSQIS